MESKIPAKKPYLSAFGALALAFGCTVGWGAFVMPGNTFLPVAGPIGTIIGIALGALVMLLVAINYHTLMKRFPEGGGGAYTYTKECFGHDQGFLTAWFIVLTYLGVIWANATALPLIARVFFGDLFQKVYLFTMWTGDKVYLVEILLSVLALALGAFACFRRRLAARVQIGLAIALFIGVIVIFIAAFSHNGGTINGPAFSPQNGGFVGAMTIFALAPWAFVGFESISHSSGESKFPMKRAFLIMAIALGASLIVYAFLALVACSAIPEGTSSWVDYLANLGNYTKSASSPTFYGANVALGTAGSVIIGVAALGAIFTGIIGNYIALSRLVSSMAGDGLLPKVLGKTDKHGVPKYALLVIFAISIILPFLGRTAISWIVDVATVGATIAFAFTSASAIKVARQASKRRDFVFGIIGLVVSFVFALIFLVPNILSVNTLSTESYFILAAWGILGFVVFLLVLHRDKEHQFGRSTLTWIVLLGLIIFASSVWMRQSTTRLLNESIAQVEASYAEKIAASLTPEEIAALEASMKESIAKIETSTLLASIGQIILIVLALVILFLVYGQIQKREKQVEVEKAIAEDRSRAKTSFLSNMSHEIRTPMNAIIGLDNIALRDPSLSPRTREHLEKIGASAKHLLGLINDILDMSRIESGRMTLKEEEFLFHDLIEQVNIIINGQCLDKGLHYECVAHGHLDDYFIGDDMKLKQILINILGNAVKFTPSGSVTLSVTQKEKVGDYGTLVFEIQDTGIGMDKDFIPKIFDAFSQEDATTTNRYGGSGLGMAITKNFVEMMGGSIAIESEKGVGSKFTVTLKFKTSEKNFVDYHGVRLVSGLQAYIIDDDEVSCEHCEMVLGSLGVKAKSFLTPEDGLDALRHAHEEGHDVEIVLTDYRMPTMTGLDVARAIREYDNGKTVILIVTGYNSDVLDDEQGQDHIDGIIPKPIFAGPLVRSVFSALEAKGGPLSQQTPAQTEEELSLAGLRVLMAEDVDANAEILGDLLDLEDILSERAENGEIAVKKFLENEPGYYDAILMDVRMPVKDGLVAASEIRASEKADAKTIPIIAMTANVFDEDVQRSLSAGMNAHLCKPIEPERLYDELRRLAKKD